MSSSPLFSLPAELRNMIYGHLLSQKDPVFITGDQFSRHPNLNICYCCSRSFRNEAELDFHKYSMRLGSRASVSSLSPSILRTCRFVHAEAIHVLYHFNDIILEEPIAAKKFSTYVDQKQVTQLEKIHLRYDTRNLRSWTSYFVTGSKDFPNLKRIHLSNWAEYNLMRCHKMTSLLTALVKSFNSVETIVFDESYYPSPRNMYVAAFEALKKIKNAIKVMRIYKVPAELVKSEKEGLDYPLVAPEKLLHQVFEDGAWRTSASYQRPIYFAKPSSDQTGYLSLSSPSCISLQSAPSTTPQNHHST